MRTAYGELLNNRVEMQCAQRMPADPMRIGQHKQPASTRLRRANRNAANDGDLVGDRGRRRVGDEAADIASRIGVGDDADGRDVCWHRRTVVAREAAPKKAAAPLGPRALLLVRSRQSLK